MTASPAKLTRATQEVSQGRGSRARSTSCFLRSLVIHVVLVCGDREWAREGSWQTCDCHSRVWQRTSLARGPRVPPRGSPVLAEQEWQPLGRVAWKLTPTCAGSDLPKPLGGSRGCLRAVTCPGLT